MITEWLAGLELISAIVLVSASFLGSLLTAAVGVGGGAFLITIMADIVPPLALIPVHGIVQLGSNTSRAVLTRKHTQWSSVGWFLLGGLVATVLSIWLLTNIQLSFIPLIIAIFILWICWGPMPEVGLANTRLGLSVGGLLTTAASMLVGASGPLVSAWLGRKSGDRWAYTANFSTCMALQHSLKIVVFGIAGFAFAEWLLLLAFMIIAGYVGTNVGLKLLGKIPERQFKTLFRWILTLLSIRLILLWWLS
ncbi:sulfite exporter TauE/SafE family protein [Alteromonas facilis]|uniref:sulfite exporter TauE/SafE family protein n=1 Tax=Alteromonas facilis TaxID=2048004 RepID=UPI000C281B9D|nr:sulfite exporter TauE/SafE family protein [Alteromonas facilis]